MLDAVIIAIPYSSIEQVQSAPAVLSGVLNHNGLKSKGFDFGTDLFKICNKNTERFYNIQEYFLSPTMEIPAEVSELYEHIIKVLKENPSRYIGISTFTVYTHKCALEIAELIKKSGIKSKIVVGGRAVKLRLNSESFDQTKINDVEKSLLFADLLRSRGLVDYIVQGDGEDALLALINEDKNYIPDINSDQFRVPVPNFEYYQLDDYAMIEKMLPITGSKGCVRDCDFCDVRDHFGKYRFRTGADIAEEIISLTKKYKINKFQFTDSLVNGNQRELYNFCEIIADYNMKNPDNKVKWTGQWICRPQNQINKKMYNLIYLSGGEGLTVGMESGSDHVLEAINKKTDTKALFDELEQFSKHNINCQLLCFVGHPAETFNDFIDHCITIIKLIPYVRRGTITAIQGGDPLYIFEGSPLKQNPDIISSDFNPDGVWKSKSNPTNTFKERVARRMIVQDLLKKYKIPSASDYWTFDRIERIIKLYKNQINEFYATSS